jgi:hypothetical protein
VKFTPDCLADRPQSIQWRLATAYAGPSKTENVVGYVDAVLRITHAGDQSRQLTIGLDFEPAHTPGERASWLESVGDWGYGIEHDGVRRSGDWIQLIGRPFPSPIWLFTRTPSFGAHVDSVQGRLVALEPLEATGPTGAKVRIEAGTYLIQSIRNGVVSFRVELPSDMPCGEDVKPPPRPPASMSAIASEFFNSDGTARFSLAYPRGC